MPKSLSFITNTKEETKMLEILPIQNKNEQRKMCEHLGVEYSQDMLAYSARYAGQLCGICQFKMTSRGGSLFSLTCAKQLPEDITEFQVLFTLGRAALNFIDLCGVHKAYYDGKDTDDMLLRQIGFTKNADGEYFIDLEGFFTSPCKCQSK